MIIDSTTKVEYIIAFESTKETVWIRKFILGLGVVLSIVDMIPLYCDNNKVIVQVEDSGSH